jgi:hypothetical protein
MSLLPRATLHSDSEQLWTFQMSLIPGLTRGRVLVAILDILDIPDP